MLCFVLAAVASGSGVGSLVDVERYPIDSLESGWVLSKRRDFRERGLASFPGFLRPAAVNAAVAAIDESKAWATDDAHNAYQLEPNASFAVDHVRNARMRTRVASIAYDELTGPSRDVYDSLAPLVSAVVGRPVHQLADPLGAATINVFRPGWDHAWHYDEARFTVTLALRRGEGGDFEYTPPLRGEEDDDPAFQATADVINAHSDYAVRPAACGSQGGQPDVRVAPFDPGTLQIFNGRSSLHRVTTVLGNETRLVAVYCFSDRPGFVNTPQVQRMFWGRAST